MLKMYRKAHRKSIQRDCENANGDSGKMWKVINKNLKSKDKPYISPDFVKVVTAEGNTEKIQDKTKIANEMNKQFVEMGAKLAPSNTNLSDNLPTSFLSINLYSHPN